jgi:hypothetical protein
MGLADRFEQAFLSHEIGHLKPAPEAFLFALEGMRLAPSEVLLIDDGLPKPLVALLPVIVPNGPMPLTIGACLEYAIWPRIAEEAGRPEVAGLLAEHEARRGT